MNIKEEIKRLNIRDIVIEKKLTRALNVIGKVKKSYDVEGTDFISPEIIGYLIPILRNQRDLEFVFSGGYEDAEYTILMVYPDFITSCDVNDFICVLSFDLPKSFSTITHPDVLGSLMSLGIIREKIGDINILEDRVQVIVKKDIADFLLYNLEKVKRMTVKATLQPLETFEPKALAFKEISTTLKSLRLDAVLAAGFGMSRSKVVDDIKSTKVKVNHVYVESVSYAIREGDMISYRGKGRMILSQVGDRSKKDRVRVQIKKYI